MKKRKTMKKISESTQGLLTKGLIKTGEPLYKVVIFADNIDNIIGFRSQLGNTVVDGTIYIEVGHYMQMLYEGNWQATDVLFDTQAENSPEFELITEIKDQFINWNTLNGLIAEIEDPFRQLYNTMLATNLLLHSKYEANLLVLQQVLDGKLDTDENLKKYLGKFKEAEGRVSVPNYADTTILNKTLLDIRHA